MTDFLESLSKFVPDAFKSKEEPKPQTQATPVDIRNFNQAGFTTPEAALTLNTARDRGNTLATDNPVVQDADELSAIDFFLKYGDQGSAAATNLDAQRMNDVPLQVDERNTLTQAGDIALGVGSGAVQSVGGIAALGAGLVNTDAGIAVSQGLDQVKTFTDGLNSTEIQEARKLDAIRTELDNQDNKKLYEADKEKDGEFIASMKDVGRDFLSGAERLFEDSRVLETGLAEGSGSLLVAGPVGKGVGLAAGGIKAVSTMPAAIALMESGSVYSQTVNEVMDMTPEELSQNSPDYRDAIASGSSPEEARKAVADRAAKIAAAIQAPLAAATGKLVAKFEADPLAARSFGSFVRNIMNETTEEGIQSLSGEMAGNYGIQLTADDTQRISEGVGAATAQGAILGAGTAGAVQSAGAAIAGPATVAKIAAETVGGARDAIKARADRIQQENQTSSGITPEAASEGIEEAKVQAPIMEQAIETMATQTGSDAVEPIARLREVTSIEPKEMGRTLGRLLIENGLNDPQSRLEAVGIAAQIAANAENTQADRTTAGLFLLDQLDRQERLYGEGLDDMLSQIDQGSEEYQLFDNYKKLLGLVQNLPQTQEAMKFAVDYLNAPTDQPLEVNQQNIENAVDAAAIKPSVVNEANAIEILKQSDEGTVDLEPEKKHSLRNAVSLLEAGRVYDQIMKANEERANQDYTPESGTSIVARQIETEGGKKNYQFSMEQHIKRINAAQNDTVRRDRVAALNKFALHMNHKMEAFNESLKTGQPVKYQTLGADHQWMNPADYYPITAYANKEGSLSLGRQIAAEAEAVAKLSNDISARYPSYGIPKVTAVKPDPAVFKAPQKRVQDTRTAAERVADEVRDTAPKASPAEPTATPATEAAKPGTIAETPSEGGTESQAITKKEPQQSGMELPTEEARPASEASSEPVVAKAEKEVDPTSVKGRFPNLLKADSKENMLHKAYRFSSKNESRFISMTSPLRNFRDEVRKNGGDNIPYVVSVDQREGFAKLFSMMSRVQENVSQRTNEALNQKKGKSSLLEMLANGIEINRFRNGRIANIGELSEDGFKLNKQLLGSAILATSHWMLGSATATYKMGREDIARILNTEETSINEDLVRQFNLGITLDQAAKSLADTIQQFWGMEERSDANLSDTKGITESLAKSILNSLQDENLIAIDELNLFEEFGVKPKRVRFDLQDTEVKDVIDTLRPVAGLIADSGLSSPKKEGWFLGQASKDIAQKQLRNALVETTIEQRKVIEKAQNIPFYLNESMADLIGSMPKEFFIELMGGDLRDADYQNVNHARSIEGKNRTLAVSYENVLGDVARMRNETPAGTKVSDLARYFEFGISRVNRLQMQGLNNPQADKLAREIFLPTKVMLDMRDPNGPDADAFWMTVAQGIGIKTELNSNADAIAEAKERISGKFAPLVQQVRTWLNEGGDLPQATLDGFKAAKLSLHGVHSILAVAKYFEEEGKDSLGNFTHFNYLEADGKTNGPINSVMLFSTGSFTNEWLNLVNKGGAFIGEDRKTLDEHVASSEENSKDLYKKVSEKSAINQGNVAKSLTPEAATQFQAFQRMLNALNKNVTLLSDENGEYLEFDRGIAKNPLTVRIYRSGVNGIADKITAEFMTSLYETFSNLNNGQKFNYVGTEQFLADLNALTTKFPEKDFKRGGYNIKGIEGSAGPNQSLADFTLNKDQIKALTANFRAFLVDPIADAINTEVLGNVETAVAAIQEATQLQSVVMAGLFRNEIITALADRQLNPDKYPDWRKGDFLSEKELQDIRKRLLKFSPPISTGSQNFLPSGSEQGKLFETTEIEINDQKIKVSMPESFSESIYGEPLRTDPYVFGFNEAGVGAVASMVIGSGDGQMIQNAIMRGVKGLFVFDGINLSAKDMLSASATINEAVMDTWTRNPMRPVADSFRNFLQSGALDAVTNDNPLNIKKGYMIQKISDAAKGEKNTTELLNDENLKKYLEGVLANLESLADDIDRRQKVLRQMPASIDQMASASNPYVQKGSVPLVPNGDKDLIIQQMNELLNQEQKTPAAESVQAPTEAMTKAVERYTTQHESGARVASIFGLGAIVAGSDLPKGLRQLADATLGQIANDGYQVVFGTPEQLDAWEQSTQPETFVGSQNNGFGKTNFLTKTIFLSNQSPETLVHEMVHAATITKTVQFVSDSSKLSPTDRDAFTRIESLMEEYVSKEYGAESGPIADARRQALSTINGYINEGKRAAAINEFMAWGLTNQNLIEDLKRNTVSDRFKKLIKGVVTQIKRVIFEDGRKGPAVNEDAFSNLRFNTRVILSTPSTVEGVQKDLNVISLHQSASFGSDQRLTDLYTRFAEKIGTYITGADNDLTKEVNRVKAMRTQLASTEVAQSFMAHGFSMTPQQYSTFEVIVSALATEMELNSGSLVRIEEIYQHVIKNLNVADFINQDNPNQDAEAYMANEKYNVLNGVYLKEFDSANRSSLMPAFLALAMVYDGFRDILSKMDKPKAVSKVDGTLDGYINNLGEQAINELSVRMAGEPKGANDVKSALDALTVSLVQKTGEQRTLIEQYGQNTFDGIENYMADQLQNLGAKMADKGRTIDNIGGKLMTLVGMMIDDKQSGLLAEGVVSILNSENANTTFRELANEIIGRTESNAPIFDMISKVRAMVDQARQQFREKLPQQIKSKFTRELTKQEKADLFVGLGKTDLGSLHSYHGLDGSIQFALDADLRQREIDRLMETLKATESGTRLTAIDAKARQLAHFMVTGEQGSMLLSNAYAVAHLVGEPSAVRIGQADTIVPIVDQLVTLHALGELSEGTVESLRNLNETEKDGLHYAFGTLIGTRATELDKNTDLVSKLNNYKGFIKSENQQGLSLVVADATEHAKLLGMSYQKVADYQGSSAELSDVKRAYYFAPMMGQAKYNQGIMQTVHQTVNGVDPKTGYTMGMLTAGRIDTPKDVSRITRSLRNQRATAENLRPVFSANGIIIAYERMIDPIQLARLNPSEDLTQMLGNWRGRQMEERLSKEINNALIDTLYNAWNKAENRSEFIALDRSDDPVHQEAWKLIPNHTKAYIKEVFGNKGFYVRRSELNDVAGFRQASVGDSWTGNTRWAPAVQEEIKNLAIGIFGNKAYSAFVNSEKLVQDVVTEAKVLIVIKSVVVPIANLFSNVFQLSTNGVPIRNIVKGMAEKTNELNAFIQGRDKKIRLGNDLLAAQGRNDLVAIRKLETQIQSIEDAERRMTIWPLIENGEFSAITEGGVSQEDIALSSGRWSDIIDKLADKVPSGLKTPYRYAMLTRDTALFQALAKATQYGDFLAKAVMYEDLIKRKKLSKKEALANVQEEFINYNRLAGRTRNYAESVGLIWFWNFKLRSMKIAARTMKRHPLRALMFMGMTPNFPLVGSIGSPLTDNMAGVLADGRLGYSMGPGMAFRAPSLNPWYGLFG